LFLKGKEYMLKHFLILSGLALLATLAVLASDREDDFNRTRGAAKVFKEIMRAPDKGIPDEILESAKCIAIISGDKKFAFIFGGNYGRGLATCQPQHGWSAPIFVAVDGGTVAYQIGGSSTDIVMIHERSRPREPVGRHASASTDIKSNAEILSYWRARASLPESV
jgi:lipid-binding SYLF domain-containing protein